MTAGDESGMGGDKPHFTARVLTLFPSMFPGPLGESLAGRAREKGIWSLDVTDIRDFATDRHRSVDDAPFGGGAGMVMRPDVLAAAIDATWQGGDGAGGGGTDDDGTAEPLIYFSPRGQRMDQALVQEIAACGSATLICGRFEGVDERILEARPVREVSLGDFILSGGEIAALALLDAVIRLLPGVAGNSESLEQESFAAGLLEYPQYTRPQVWEGRPVPEVLLSGHHERIRQWRLDAAKRITKERRRDLWERWKKQS